jgi:hypothetical protein
MAPRGEVILNPSHPQMDIMGIFTLAPVQRFHVQQSADVVETPKCAGLCMPISWKQ